MTYVTGNPPTAEEEELREVISQIWDEFRRVEVGVREKIREGTATILNGTTSIAVTHLLQRPPNVEDIFLQGTENPTNDPGNLWVSTITATQFTINCRNDPGASGLDVSWKLFL